METERRHRQGVGGFTLVEVLMAMAIVAIGILGVAGMQVRAVSANAVARKALHATALAAGRMEQLIGLGYDHPVLADRSGDGAAGLDNDTAETSDGADSSHPPYTVCWNVARIPATPNPETIGYKRLRVIVTWRDRGVRRRYPLETILVDR